MSEKILLNKTSIKGLYLTSEGKAWRNDFKTEIKPTRGGKIRFNGILYDLQKIIERTSQKPLKTIIAEQLPAVKKSISARELQKHGFKETKISGLYVSKTGQAYNRILRKFLTVTGRGNIVINSKAYNFAKLILETFQNIAVRSGQINFINGNTKDFIYTNLEYRSTIKQLPPVATDLIKCIRLYFEVDKSFTTSSVLYKYYLHEIIKMRNFKYTGIDFDLFSEYLKTDFFGISDNQKTVFEKFSYTTTNGKNAINKYLSLLVSECLQDFENGLLKVKELKPKELKPKPPSKRQKLKELQKWVNENGLNIKIPLRKKSNKELLNDYEKHTKALELKIKNLKNEPLTN